MENCTLCPRECGADRAVRTGVCRAPRKAVVAKVMIHTGEEPCIGFFPGAGAVFFSGCPLRCVFCQNHEISWNIRGEECDADALCETFLKLQEKGAACLDLVSPTPYLRTIVPALEKAKKSGLAIPVVYNTGSYEKAESLKILDGLVDIYLPDLKFYSSALSSRYAACRDYAEKAFTALDEMLRQAPRLVWKEPGKLGRGVIVRHLILPGQTNDSIALLSALAARAEPHSLILSLMRQYTPCHKAGEFPELNRKLTSLEYRKVVDRAFDLGFTNVYTQGKDSAGTELIPDFSTSQASGSSDK